jgi:hypothetical protein
LHAVFSRPSWYTDHGSPNTAPGCCGWTPALCFERVFDSQPLAWEISTDRHAAAASASKHRQTFDIVDHVLIVISLICAALLATSQVCKRFLVARFSLSQSRVWSGTSFARGPRAHRPCSCATEPSGVCARVCGVLRTPHATSHNAMLRHSGNRYTGHAIVPSTPRLLRCIGCVSSGVRRCVEVLPTTQPA